MYLDRLQNLCEKDNITMTELAKYVGIDRSTIGKYVSGYLISIPLVHLNSICNFFGISLDYILQLSTSPKYNKLSLNINNKLFADRLKKLRKENKLSQEKLASILDCSHSVISDYETQKRLISVSHLYTICKKLNVSADYLLGKTNKKYR